MVLKGGRWEARNGDGAIVHVLHRLLAVTGGVLAPEGAIGNTLISVFISVYTYIWLIAMGYYELLWL